MKRLRQHKKKGKQIQMPWSLMKRLYLLADGKDWLKSYVFCLILNYVKLYRFACQLSKWQVKRKNQLQEFEGSLYGHLMQMLRNSEKIIRYFAYLKKTMEIVNLKCV